MTSCDLPRNTTGLPMGRQHIGGFGNLMEDTQGIPKVGFVNTIVSKLHKMKRCGAFLEAKT